MPHLKFSCQNNVIVVKILLYQNLNHFPNQQSLPQWKQLLILITLVIINVKIGRLFVPATVTPSMWDMCHACRQTGHWRRECPRLARMYSVTRLILDDPYCSSACLTDFLLILGVGGNNIRFIFSNSGPTSSRSISSAYDKTVNDKYLHCISGCDWGNGLNSDIEVFLQQLHYFDMKISDVASTFSSPVSRLSAGMTHVPHRRRDRCRHEKAAYFDV
jgi:hypothetical protein